MGGEAPVYTSMEDRSDFCPPKQFDDRQGHKAMLSSSGSNGGKAGTVKPQMSNVSAYGSK